MEFTEAEMTPIYHSGAEEGGGLLEIIFEVDSIANKTHRSVYNLQAALGWIGGLLTLIKLIQGYLVKPFITDAIVYKVAQLSISGKEVGIDATNFYLKKTLRNIMCLKCCKKIDIIFDDEFRKREIVFEYHKD